MNTQSTVVMVGTVVYIGAVIVAYKREHNTALLWLTHPWWTFKLRVQMWLIRRRFKGGG